MTDFEAAVSSRVRLWRKGRVTIPPNNSRADLGECRGVRETALRLARGVYGGMILMQVKRAGFRPGHSVGQSPPQ